MFKKQHFHNKVAWWKNILDIKKQNYPLYSVILLWTNIFTILNELNSNRDNILTSQASWMKKVYNSLRAIFKLWLKQSCRYNCFKFIKLHLRSLILNFPANSLSHQNNDLRREERNLPISICSDEGILAIFNLIFS